MKTLLLRWTDDKGVDHSKEYIDEREARKAKTWLLENGADNVDIAIQLQTRNTSAKNTEV